METDIAGVWIKHDESGIKRFALVQTEKMIFSIIFCIFMYKKTIGR